MSINTVTVIGSGTMGAQIAMVSALSGARTFVVDIKDEPLKAADEMLHKRMNRDIEKSRRTQEDVDAAFERLTFSTDRDAAAAESDLIIEAATENIDIKRQIFEGVDAVAPEHAIIATNSSNIVSSALANSTKRPDRVCNMHFFNPVLIMTCVEVVGGEHTSKETLDAVAEFGEKMGKDVVRLNKEVPGFIANRLLNALRAEALELYEDGVADFKDIDVAAKTALRHPMGPFELMDMTGLDVVYMIRKAEYEQTGDPASLPSKSVTELYERGDYGRKTGKGWYTYDK